MPNLKPAEDPAHRVADLVRSEQRRAALKSLSVPENEKDSDFDRLTGLAANIMATPIAVLSLVDLDRQWFKSVVGTDARESPIEHSFCAHAIADAAGLLVVEDASRDARFAAKNPLRMDPSPRFYVGVPIVVFGQRIGTLSVFDIPPRTRPSNATIDQLKALAALTSSLFELKDSTHSGALAHAALAREEKRRAIAVEAASLASWVWHIQTGFVECDALLPELFGLAPATRMSARRMFAAIDRRDSREAEARFNEAVESSDDYSGEYRIRNTHPPRWLATRGRVIERDKDGQPLLLFGVNYDISERKALEERQRLLLRELNHRVKNTLATVQALATQTVRHARQPSEFVAAFSARLQALGVAHNLLSDHEWRGIGLRELIKLEVTPFDDERAPRIDVTGKDLLLSPDQAVGLGLILHELASNALKYGSLSTVGGRVDLSWRIEGSGQDRKLELRWTERGGPPVAAPTHQGFGTILIRRSLAKILASEVSHEFKRGGVVATIAFPLEAEPS